jgi:hypothetical protein
MHDVVTPDFYRRSHAGEIINNQYDKTKVTVIREPVSYYEGRLLYTLLNCAGVGTNLHNVTTGERRFGTRSPTLLLGATYATAPTLDVERIKNIAVTGAHAKANEQDVEGLVVLAEGEKTIKSLTSMTLRAIRILRALRKWDVQRLYREMTPKELSNRWMEGRYAIRPFVKDVTDIVKAITRDRSNNPLRRTYRSGHSDSSTNTFAGVVTYSNSNYWSVIADKETTVTVSARGGVLSAIDAISEATIWGLNQPFSAMWELVPFSFVCDWFFNVGKTIAAWSPKYGIRELASWVTVDTTVLEVIQTNRIQLGSWNGGTQVYENAASGSGGSVTRVTKTKVRIPKPTLSVTPTWNVRLDAAKLLDLAIMGKRFL